MNDDKNNRSPLRTSANSFEERPIGIPNTKSGKCSAQGSDALKNLRSPTQISRENFLKFVLKNKEKLEYPFEVL